MASRAKDWYAQAERDIEVARRDAAGSYFEWACFAAHQAAEKALKALYQHLGGEARGHDLDGLLQGLASRVPVPKTLFSKVADLGKHYIGTRYPNAHADGPPFRHYTRVEAQRAIRYAEAVLWFCRSHLA